MTATGKLIHKLNRLTPISQNWTQNQMWPCDVSWGMRAGYPSLPHSPLGHQGPQESLVGLRGAELAAGESPIHHRRRHVRVSGQDRKPLSGRRSSQAPLMLKHQHLGSTGKKTKKTLKKTVGKRTIQKHWVDSFHFPHCLCCQSNMLEPFICYWVAACTVINPPVPTHESAKGRRWSLVMLSLCSDLSQLCGKVDWSHWTTA